MSQLRDAAATWHNACYQVKRTTGCYDRGSWVEHGVDLSWELGNIQPAQQAQIERLAEGARSDGSIVIFTHAVHRTAESPDGPADRVIVSGVEYEVSRGERWASYNEYTCTKAGQ